MGSAVRTANRGDAFVTGGIAADKARTFRFTGYREGEWKLSPLLDPDEIIKPRLVGEIRAESGETSIVYRVDAFVPSLLFFILSITAVVLAVLGAIVTAVAGISVPSAAFALFLLSGVSGFFAISIWQAASKAQADEDYLLEWLRRAIGYGYSLHAD